MTDALLTSLKRTHRPTPPPIVIGRTIEIREEEHERILISIGILPVENPKITIGAIKRVVCNHFGLSEALLCSPLRDKDICIPRMVAIYLCRNHTSHGLPTIGKHFGDRDHSTIHNSVKRIKKLIATNAGLATHIRDLEEQLTA